MIVLDQELEDSEDITEQEVLEAMPTQGSGHLARCVIEALQRLEADLKAQELRRKNGHHYYRARLQSSDGSEHVLVFGIDWVNP